VALAARDKNLLRVLPKAFELALDTSVTMHENLRTSRSCRAVFDALVAGLQAYVQKQNTAAAAGQARQVPHPWINRNRGGTSV